MAECCARIPESGRGRHRTFTGRSCRNKVWRKGYCKKCYEHRVSQLLADYHEMFEAFKYALENGIEPYGS